MKKRIGKFLLYKVLELTGAVIVYLGMSWYGHWFFILTKTSDYNPNCWFDRWVLAPFVGTLTIILFGFILLLIHHWIKWNWEKAGE